MLFSGKTMIKKKTKGFSLLEVMFAIVFIGSSFAIIFSLMTHFIKITNNITDKSNNIVENKIVFSENDPMFFSRDEKEDKNNNKKFEKKEISKNSNLSKYENLIQVDVVKKNNEKNENNFKNNTFKQALYKVELEKKQEKNDIQ